MAGNTKEEKELNFKPYIVFAITMAIVVIIAYILNFNNQSISKDSGDWGTFGDFIGGTLNPTLAFLSFLALLQTIKIQSKELKKSSEALELSKEELAKSSEALAEQSKSLKIQNFENTFFNMLDLYLSLKNRLNQNPPEIRSIKYKLDNIEYVFNTKLYIQKINSKNEGIPRLSHILFLFLNESNRFPKEFRNIPIDEIEEEIKLKYKKNQLNDTKNLYIYFTNFYGKYLNHLMRTIYHIINFVDTNDNIKNKKFYVNLLRSQIDISETVLIFYNGISKQGENLLPLLIKYEFFEHLVYNEFICKPTLKLYIKKTKQLNKNFPINKAFGKNPNYKNLLEELTRETDMICQQFIGHKIYNLTNHF